MKTPLVALLAAGLTVALPTPLAQAAESRCVTSTTPHPANKIATAGEASARGLFVTYEDWDTVLEGGMLVPPDLGVPVAQAAVDRTGLGAALAGQAYSPYNDATGTLNAFAGTALPADALSEPSRTTVSGRPPQQQTVAIGNGCVRLADGPSAEAITDATDLGKSFTVQGGEVRSFAGPHGESSSLARSAVVLTDVRIGQLRIEEVVLTVTALADGAIGVGTARSVISGLTIGGQPFDLTPHGLSPVGARLPDSGALAASGIELLSSGSSGHTNSSNISRAWATGPTLRVSTEDGRMLTVVLGTASAIAERGRV